MKVYTVEEASEITLVPEIEIVDSVRTGVVKITAGSTAEPSFPVPYTSATIRHKSTMRIAADELDQIHVDLDHRWQHLWCLRDAMDEGSAIGLIRDALVTWYGAALDNPEDREAAGVIECLKAFASYIGLKRDGSFDEARRKKRP